MYVELLAFLSYIPRSRSIAFIGTSNLSLIFIRVPGGNGHTLLLQPSQRQNSTEPWTLIDNMGHTQFQFLLH